jgi:hypothetical protein
VWEFLAQQARTAAFQASYQTVDAELGIHLTKEMHVVGHNFELDDLGPEVLRCLEQDFFQARIHTVHEHWPAILWAPDDVVLARVHEVVVASEWNVCSHTSIISEKRIWHKTDLESEVRRFLPRPEGRGIRAGDSVRGSEGRALPEGGQD